jgi:hypothetical protein
MDAIYFRDKAQTCLRLAKGLSWNNPARGELMELAEEFQRQARNSKLPPVQNNRLHADWGLGAKASRPAVSSAHHEREKFSSIFKD